MSSKNIKELRSQTRNVVQEILPALLKTEVFQGLAEAIEQKLKTEMVQRLELIQTQVTESLEQMNNRSKDIQQFILNQVQSEMARNAPKVVVEEHASEEAKLTPKA